MILRLFKKSFNLLSDKRILIIALILFFLITSKAYYNHIFFLDFADEEENFLPGKYLLTGKKLYSDMFLQHQPAAYIASAFIQKIVHPQTISALVKTHRISMILWSALWTILLTLRFGLPLLITVFIIELSKISLLGNLFLAESLVVYPLVYIGAYMFFIKKDLLIEYFFVSLLTVFIFYSLLPLWPLIIFISLFFIFRLRNLKRLLVFSGIFFLAAIIIFQFASIKDYFYNTIYITLKYYLPLTKHFSGTFSPLHGFIAPILALFDTKNTHLLWVIKSISLVLLLNLLLLIKYKKIKECLLIIFILGLASIRYVKADTELYGAFHMLPWFSLLTLYVSITSFQIYKQSQSKLVKLFNIFSILFILLVAFFQSKYTLFDIRDQKTDLHVHYSPHYNYSDALKIIKKPNDTLFVVPVNMLVYWNSDIKPVSKYIYFYEWMEKTPLTEDVKRIFTKNPPDFLYCVDCKKSVVFSFIDHYHQLKKSGDQSFLYIKKDLFKQISQDQKQKLNFFGFSF